MENFKRKNERIFNPEKSFIEHADKEHEASLKRKKVDLEYQKEFGDFFLSLFKGAKIDISHSLEYCLEDASDLYCSLSLYLCEAITSGDPRDRLLLDSEARERFYKKKYRIMSKKKLNDLITEAYAKKVDFDKLLSLMENETEQARKNLLVLIVQIINPRAIPKREDEVKINMAPSAPCVGGCVMAEKNMLAYISGKHTKPEGGGYVNLIVDDNGSPLMLEKIKLGDTHSCISLKPVRINGVFIPAGAIFSAQPDAFEPIRLKIRWFTKVEGAINYVTKVKNYEGFKFVRMSLLSLPEDIRASAGGDTYIHQQDKTKGYINYDWLTPEIIADYASQRLRNAGILEKLRKKPFT